MDVQLLGERAGAEEQRDLHQALVHEVDKAANDGEGPEQTCPQGDVGDLADGGKGQPPLDVGLLQGADGAVDDGQGGKAGQWQAKPQLKDERGAVVS
jgi:hypothetical protein